MGVNRSPLPPQWSWSPLPPLWCGVGGAGLVIFASHPPHRLFYVAVLKAKEKTSTTVNSIIRNIRKSKQKDKVSKKPVVNLHLRALTLELGVMRSFPNCRKP